MILVYGHADEGPIERVAASLAARGVDHIVVDQRRPDTWDLQLGLGASGVQGCVTVGAQRIPLGEITATYARPLSPPAGVDGRVDARTAASQAAIVEWLDVADGLVINRPEAMHSNASKPFQAQLIGACGITVPETLVSNEAEAVREFLQRHGSLVFKSTSGIRSIVRVLDDYQLGRLDHVGVLATQFQALVPGTDIRVHVVGPELFATEIVSEATDYRYAGRDGHAITLQPYELPPDVAASCHLLAERLALPLCGIDLRRTPASDHVCFEVNPMPGYSYFEGETGQPIAAAIARLLTAG